MDIYKGRTAVITGASRGLGLGLAKTFFGMGVKVGLCGRSMQAEAQAGVVLARPCDVTDAAQVEAFGAEVAEALGPIDLWINNAGVLDPIAALRDISPGDFAAHVAVNLAGVFHGTGTYVRHLRATGHSGVLLNISSGAARKGYAGWSAYCATKAAVDRLTECVALEEAPQLRAHSVAPGVIDTDMQALIRATPAERFPLRDKFVQLKADDAFSTPEHVARELLALAFGPDGDQADLLLRLPPGR